MGNDPKQPLMGELSIDATDLTFLVDLEPGARARLRSAQPGLGDTLAEIEANQIVGNGASLVPEPTFRELMLVGERIGQIDAKLPAVSKLAEMMVETRALLEDQRQRLISAVAAMVEAQGKALGDSAILARYEKTRAYRSAIAIKALRTRRRNQEGALDLEEPASQTAPASPAGAPPAASP